MAFPFLLAWSAAAVRVVPFSMGCVCIPSWWVGCVCILSWRVGLRGGVVGRGAFAAAVGSFLGARGFLLGLGFLWGSVFRLRFWLGGVSSFLVAVLGLGSFLLAWSWWLRSGAAKHRRRVRRRRRYAVGFVGCCAPPRAVAGFRPTRGRAVAWFAPRVPLWVPQSPKRPATVLGRRMAAAVVLRVA